MTWESQLRSADWLLARKVGLRGRRKLLTRRRMSIWWWTSQIKPHLFTLLNVSMVEASAKCLIEICYSQSWLLLQLNKIPWIIACQLVVSSRYQWLLQIPLTVLTKWIWQTLHQMMRSVLQSQKTQGQPNKYLIPPKRPGYQGSTLDSIATPFVPRSQRPERTRGSQDSRSTVTGEHELLASVLIFISFLIFSAVGFMPGTAISEWVFNFCAV